jgi:hypothetical protein
MHNIARLLWNLLLRWLWWTGCDFAGIEFLTARKRRLTS